MIFLALLITAAVYLIYPVLYVANNGKVSPKKGKKLAFWDVFVCAMIFLTFTLILAGSGSKSGGQIGGYSFAPAFFYYFIAKAILTDKTLPDDDGNFINGKKEEPQEADPSEEEKKEDDDFDDNI